MKTTTLTIITASLLLAPLFSNAQTATAKCVEREDQIRDVPKINNFVAKIGGMNVLEGDWKLSGMAGAFKRVIISFESANDGLKAQIEGLDDTAAKWGAITICDTVRPDTLFVKVKKEDDQLYIRQGSGGTLQLAQIENGKVGTFYSFKKQH